MDDGALSLRRLMEPRVMLRHLAAAAGTRACRLVSQVRLPKSQAPFFSGLSQPPDEPRFHLRNARSTGPVT